MAKIPELPSAGPIQPDDLAVVWQAGKTRKVPAAALGGGGSPNWDSIGNKPAVIAAGADKATARAAIDAVASDDARLSDARTPTAAGLAATVHAAASKPTPADADKFGFLNSASGWGLVSGTWANLKAVLLAYFQGQFREKLTAPRTYYVRTDGNDNNTGLSNTAGGAFATIQKAVDMIAGLDVGLQQVTVQVGPGTHAPFELKPYVGAKAPQITGSPTTPETVLINASSGGLNSVLAFDAGAWSIGGIKVQSAGASGFRIEGRSSLTINGPCEFGACASRHVFAYRSFVNIAANIKITGGAGTSLESGYPGALLSFTSGYSCTLVGTPAFSNAFASAILNGVAVVNGITFSGAATGARYRVTSAGIIQTFGYGTGYLPGDALGAVSEGGQYI